MLLLAVTGTWWLVVASCLAELASIKLHAPGLLANCAWLTYGRVQPAAWNAFAYGFATPVGLGVAAWLMCRLAGACLLGGRTIALATLLWNAGVLLGVLGILAGDSTGLPTLELPTYASPLLFLAYLGIAVWVVLAFHHRRQAAVYVSEWYLLGGLFSFPWLYSAANLLAVFCPLRGVLQAATQAWYAHGLLTLWFTSLSLAIIFYLGPKLTGVPVPSRSLATFGFWTLALFGSLGGLTRYSGGPFPAWMTSLSVVAEVLTVVPVVAVGLNLVGVWRGQAAAVKASPPLWFATAALVAFLIAGVLAALNALPSISRVTHFTLVTPALELLNLQGMVALALLGALYFLIPHLAGGAWPLRGLVRLHFVCAVAGVLIGFAALGVGGVSQGLAMNDPAVPFFGVVKVYLPFAATGTLANLLLALGNLMLFVNLIWLLVRQALTAFVPVAKTWVAGAATAEVRA